LMEGKLISPENMRAQARQSNKRGKTIRDDHSGDQLVLSPHHRPHLVMRGRLSASPVLRVEAMRLDRERL
jgi:hypothetical protein